MEAVDKAGYYRKRSKETPKARKAKGTKITRPHTEERTRLRTEERNRQEERKRGRHIFRMPFWRPLHSRCLGGVYLHQQAHDTHVHHLDNRHATGDGPWLMAVGPSVCTCLITIKKRMPPDSQNNHKHHPSGVKGI